jgi:hypothetical protein
MTETKSLANNNMTEMLRRQLHTVQSDKKLRADDIRRICEWISSSIFEKVRCSLWNGYITNDKHTHKWRYVNFYFNCKKVPLHRLLYINFVENLEDTEYIRYDCPNKGVCCNINHMTRKRSKSTKDSSAPVILHKRVHIERDKKFIVEF